jgi:spermidine/putrescine transport system ATP-binding protein
VSAAIEVIGVTRRYGTQAALDGIGLTVPAGDYCVLLGPSGCGKTTLLNILGGFADPTEGIVRIGGAEMVGVPAAARPTTTVFQDYALFPHMTVLDNVAFGLRMRAVAAPARRAKAEAMLALVGLAGQGWKRPGALSGGQKQRVALARALAVEPQVLLLDEPLGALDLALRRTMQEELKAIQRRVGATFVHVTHDQEEAMALADLLVVMNRGRIEDQGPPERLYRRPQSRFSATFLGAMNLIPGVARGGVAATALGPVAVEGPDGPVTLGLRPEQLHLDGRLQATVVATLFQGSHRRVHVTAGGLDLIAHLPVGRTPTPGERLPLGFDPADLILLPEAP